MYVCIRILQYTVHMYTYTTVYSAYVYVYYYIQCIRILSIFLYNCVCITGPVTYTRVNLDIRVNFPDKINGFCMQSYTFCVRPLRSFLRTSQHFLKLQNRKKTKTITPRVTQIHSRAEMNTRVSPN